MKISHRNRTLIPLAALALLFLAACGNKGPLVMPQKPVPVEEQQVEPVDDAVDDADNGADDDTVTDDATDATDAAADDVPQDGQDQGQGAQGNG